MQFFLYDILTEHIAEGKVLTSCLATWYDLCTEEVEFCKSLLAVYDMHLDRAQMEWEKGNLEVCIRSIHRIKQTKQQMKGFLGKLLKRHLHGKRVHTQNVMYWSPRIGSAPLPYEILPTPRLIPQPARLPVRINIQK